MQARALHPFATTLGRIASWPFRAFWAYCAREIEDKRGHVERGDE